MERYRERKASGFICCPTYRLFPINIKDSFSPADTSPRYGYYRVIGQETGMWRSNYRGCLRGSKINVYGYACDRAVSKAVPCGDLNGVCPISE